MSEIRDRMVANTMRLKAGNKTMNSRAMEDTYKVFRAKLNQIDARMRDF